MTRRAEITTLVWYLAIVAITFVVAYVVMGVREMALYLTLTVLNLPASLVVVPYMESFAQGTGWTLGSPVHVWLTQLICMAVNALFIGAVAVIAVSSWRSYRGRRSAV
jgi:hypothetical protein